MSDLLLIVGFALIIPVIVILTYIMAQRYRIKMTVEKGLHEEKREPITIIQAGSNFTTRMTDFKKNMDKLNDALTKRNELLHELEGTGKSTEEEKNHSDQSKSNANEM